MMDCKNIIGGSVKALKVEHAWIISNFKAHQTENGMGIMSPTFFVGGSGDLQARLVLFPNKTGVSEFASLYLYLDSRKKDEVWARFKCCLLDSKHQEVLTHRAVRGYWVGHKFVRGEGYGLKEFVHLDVLSKLLSDRNRLTVHCSIQILGKNKDAKVSDIGETVASAGQRFIEAFAVSKGVKKEKASIREENVRIKSEIKTELAEKEKHFFNFKNEFNDLIIVARDGTEFPAHRNILAARSLVFSAMFMTAGSEQNKITLNDLRSDVVREILRFVYTGKVENCKLVTELLIASEKYGLNGLKVLCENILLKVMNLSNVFEILMLADQHNVNTLKKKALETILLHAKTVVATPGFQRFKESNKTNLMAEAFFLLALSKV